MKTVIVDVDGTIANLDHRQHYLRVKPRNWGAFKKLAFDDTVHTDIVELVKFLKEGGINIVICTARTEDEKEVTVRWLHEKAGLEGVYTKLYMRETGDYRDDGTVKAELLAQIRADGFDPWFVLDDRDRVVKMWRENGIRCLQVAYGSF